MGAELIYEKCETTKLADQIKVFVGEYARSQRAIENNYSGDSGTFYEFGGVDDKPYKEVQENIEAAEEILLHKHQKYDRAMIVNIADGTSIIGGWVAS